VSKLNEMWCPTLCATSTTKNRPSKESLGKLASSSLMKMGGYLLN